MELCVMFFFAFWGLMTNLATFSKTLVIFPKHLVTLYRGSNPWKEIG
jgi:hypothetical protein